MNVVAQRRLATRERFSESVGAALREGRGFAAGKIGVTERVLLSYPVLLERERDPRRLRAFELGLEYQALRLSGIFPATPTFLRRFSDAYAAATRELDSVGVVAEGWLQDDELLRFHGWFEPATVDAVEFPYGFALTTRERYASAIDLYAELGARVAACTFDVALIAAGRSACSLRQTSRDAARWRSPSAVTCRCSSASRAGAGASAKSGGATISTTRGSRCPRATDRSRGRRTPITGEPTISVVIPVRDGERFLGEAIESVLRQSPWPLEVLVVDDGSTDGSGHVARSFGAPVRCVEQEPMGLAAALNRGVGLARGELLAFLDADDMWTDGKLRLQTDALLARRELDAVFGHAANFDGDGSTGPTLAGYSKGAMLIHRSAFDRVGGFGAWRLGEFVDWYARAVDAGLETAMLPDVVLLRRVHEDNTGVRLRDERNEYARVLKGVLDRRRAT